MNKVNLPIPSQSSQKLLKQYQKLLARLGKALQTGRFRHFSKQKQLQLIKRLKRYLRRLKRNFSNTRKLAIGAALAIALLQVSNGHAQTFIQPGGDGNPLDFVDTNNGSYPVFVDIDNDGDLDAFVGNKNGTIAFFRNDGTATAPHFSAITGAANPFDGVDVGSNAVPVFVNIDNDGDVDAFVGNGSGHLLFFQNDGTANSPMLNEVSGAGNPFDGVDVGANAAPFFVDIDNDSDLDAFVGENNRMINFYRNNGTIGTPNFIEITGSGNPFYGERIGADASVSFKDFDKDGDFDAFVGSQLGMIQYYRNKGNATTPNFKLTTGTANPFDGIDVGRNAALITTPCFADIDGDGDKDIFIGNLDGTINYFRNEADFNCTTNNLFTAKTNNPFGLTNLGEKPKVSFIDIDKDGDLDLFAGNEDGTIKFFRNKGTAGDPTFIEITGGSNPFSSVDVGNEAAITFGDIDKDGDLDAFIGAADGRVHFFRNTGTTASPTFISISGGGNPFNGVDVGANAVPKLVDIDDDGDLDAFIGEKQGKLLYFKNNGTANSPNFDQITGANNPFNGIDLEENFTPDFADIDQDGDLDAIIGNKAGSLFYFKNEGTASSPEFIGLYGKCNPLSNISQGEFPGLALVDINNDGILDLFIGRQDGIPIFYLSPTSSSPDELVIQEPIPTLSQWGLITLALFLLSFGTILIIRKEDLLLASTTNKQWGILIQKPPFYKNLFYKSLYTTALMAGIAGLVTFAIYGSIALVDVIGTLTAGPIFAYLLHLLWKESIN